MSSISVSRESDTRIKASITVNTEEIKPAEEAALKKIAAKAEIKGFRRGKAPAHLVKQKYASDVATEKLFALVDNCYEDIQKKVDERLYRLVSISDLKENNDSMSFAVSLDLYPYVKIGKLKTVQLTRHTAAIDDSDVNEEIKKRLMRFATYEDTENATAAANDKVTVDFEIWVDDAPSGEVNKDFQFDLGSGSLSRELEQQIIDKKGKVGEEFKLKKEIPQQQEEKNRSYEIIATLKKISKPKLPELTDALVAENFKGSQTVAEFKNKVKEDLERQFDLAQIRVETDKALNTLQENSEFFISESFLETQLDEFAAERKIQKDELRPEQASGLKKALGEREHSALLMRQLLRDAEKSHQKKTKSEETYMQAFRKYVHQEIIRFENDEQKASEILVDVDRALTALEEGRSEKNPWESIISSYLIVFNRQWIFDFFEEEGLVKKGKKLTYKELAALLGSTSSGPDPL
ncbi:MAG TPA: trigger factor [Turneriella sp.]|nr:trigger factor [Turneriella sp.]